MKTVYQRILKPFPSVLLLPSAASPSPSSPPSPSSSPVCGKEDDIKGKEEQRDIDLSASLLASLQHHLQPQPRPSGTASAPQTGSMNGLFVEASLVRNDNGLYNIPYPLLLFLPSSCLRHDLLVESSANGILTVLFYYKPFVQVFGWQLYG